MSMPKESAIRKALKRKGTKVLFVGEGCAPVGESLIRRAFRKKKSTVVYVEKSYFDPEKTLFSEKLAMANEMLSKIRFNDPRLRKLVE